MSALISFVAGVVRGIGRGLLFFALFVALYAPAVAQPVSTLTVVGTYNGPDGGYLRSVAWDGTTLWSCTSPDGWSSKVYRHNLDGSLSVAATYSSPTRYMTGLVWVNGRFWSVDNFGDVLVKHGTSVTTIEAMYGMNGRRSPASLAWTGANLWAPNELAMQKFNPDGSFVSEVPISDYYGGVTYQYLRQLCDIDTAQFGDFRRDVLN